MTNDPKIQRAFNRAAASYEHHAVLQQEVSTRLLQRLNYIKLQPQRVLDIGAGTGRGSALLLKRYKTAQVFALDIAFNMLVMAQKNQGWWRKFHCLVGDARQLPIASHSIDLIVSNLTLQWCLPLRPTLQEWRRVLSPGGLLMLTTLGPDTLTELRQSWAALDNTPHVNTFLDMHEIGDALLQAGFAEPVMDVDRITLTYPDLKPIMRDLKGIGAQTVTAPGRPQGLLGKQRFAQLQQQYEAFRQPEGLPATYEVVYGQAWVPPATRSVAVAFR